MYFQRLACRAVTTTPALNPQATVVCIDMSRQYQ